MNRPLTNPTGIRGLSINYGNPVPRYQVSSGMQPHFAGEITDGRRAWLPLSDDGFTTAMKWLASAQPDDIDFEKVYVLNPEELVGASWVLEPEAANGKQERARKRKLPTDGEWCSYWIEVFDGDRLIRYARGHIYKGSFDNNLNRYRTTLGFTIRVKRYDWDTEAEAITDETGHLLRRGQRLGMQIGKKGEVYRPR